ncbi:MAG: ATPase, partial [Blastocatellia bacterium]
QDQSHSLILAATNHAQVLDQALFRRFDDVLQYELPTEPQIAALLRARLAGSVNKRVSWKRLAKAAVGLSYAEITRAAEEVHKDALIHDRPGVTETEISGALMERRDVAGRLKNSR